MAEGRSYTLGQELGNETRHTEFKSSGFANSSNFRSDTAAYVCSFANSHVNGKLFIGVNDEGKVEGYNRCAQREQDRLRLQIDEAVKDIESGIFPHHYSVDFVPVADKNGKYYDDTFVIEISVQGEQLDDSQLFGTLRGVFMRRDGSVQTFNAHNIQDWVRQKYQRELDRLRMNEENLMTQLSKINSENASLQEKHARNKEEMIRLKKEVEENSAEKYQRELDRLRMNEENLMAQLSKRDREIASLQEQNTRHNEEIIRLKSEVAENSAETSNNVLREDLSQIRELIERQGETNGRKQKPSKVCVIS